MAVRELRALEVRGVVEYALGAAKLPHYEGHKFVVALVADSWSIRVNPSCFYSKIFLIQKLSGVLISTLLLKTSHNPLAGGTPNSGHVKHDSS